MNLEQLLLKVGVRESFGGEEDSVASEVSEDYNQ